MKDDSTRKLMEASLSRWISNIIEFLDGTASDSDGMNDRKAVHFRSVVDE